LEKHQGQLGLGPGDLQLAIEHTRSLKVAKKNMATILEKKHQLPWFFELKNGGSFHGKLLVITRW
jgi:hypothetical protein